MDSVSLLMLFLCILINLHSIEGFGTFGFDVHHRYSDTVKDFLDVDGLPQKGSLDYYAAMAHRDQLFKARRLTTTSTPILTFFSSNETYRLNSLGFCVRSLNSTSGRTLDLNIYSPSASATGSPVPCNSTMCGARRECSIRRNACAYQEVYLSNNTSSTGILVDDVLHLGTDQSTQTPVEAPITLGCGIIQTGDFLDGAAINGLFGLGMDSISVPSILASRGLAANSFSMCFGPDGLGRIEFGDKGSPDQNTTRFNLRALHPTYNITVTQIVVGDNVTNLEFTAIFDSGTSFTYLNDPAYSLIAESFNSQITDQRYHPETENVFDYCYSVSSNQSSYNFPILNLIMNGGNQFSVTAPTFVISRRGGYAYCLAIVRSENVNIIGQNFMTGYRIVFDREDMILGWRESDCYDSVSSNNGTTTLPVDRNNTTGASPPSLNPEATPANRTRSPVSVPSQQSIPSTPAFGNEATGLSSVLDKLMMVMFSITLCFFL